MTVAERQGVAALLLTAVVALAPVAARAGAQPAVGQPAAAQPEALRGVGIDQRLDQQVPLDLVFNDENGRAVTLGSLLHGKPVILNLVYYRCPMLCTLVLNGLLSAMKALPFDAGKEFDVFTVSFDPEDTPALAAQKKATYLEQYRRPGAAEGWHFLVGDETSIRPLMEAIGFRYAWDPEARQYAHASGLVVLTPGGRLSHYFYGVEFAPRDLRLALVEASSERIGSVVDQLLLFCFHYDPATGRYSRVALNAVRAGGILTLAALGAFLVVMLRRDRAQARRPPVVAPGTGPRC